MLKTLKKLYAVICLFRGIPAVILYMKYRKVLMADAERYLRYSPYKKVSFMMFFHTLITVMPFRSIFYMRTKDSIILNVLSRVFIKPLDSIELSTDIGEGLMIYHKIGCVINCKSAGKNLTVWQGVTVGSKRPFEGPDARPILGDNVSIAVNAVVFGRITVGNNVVIGAGSVVNKSVPDNCVVAGNPARIIKRDGIPCDEPLK